MDNVFQYILQLQNYQPMLTILTVLAAFLVGLYVFFIYRITFAGVIYSRTFNLSLVMLCMVTATVIMFMANNVKLSLGMVGALSIVRFRTAIKDPIDTVFMFWAIAEGIALGAGYFIAGVIAAVFIGLCMILISVIKGRSTMPYLLILHYDESASKQIKQMVAQLPQGRIKSKTVQREGIEMTVELRVRPERDRLRGQVHAGGGRLRRHVDRPSGGHDLLKGDPIRSFCAIVSRTPLTGARLLCYFLCKSMRYAYAREYARRI